MDELRAIVSGAESWRCGNTGLKIAEVSARRSPRWVFSGDKREGGSGCPRPLPALPPFPAQILLPKPAQCCPPVQTAPGCRGLATRGQRNPHAGESSWGSSIPQRGHRQPQQSHPRLSSRLAASVPWGCAAKGGHTHSRSPLATTSTFQFRGSSQPDPSPAESREQSSSRVSSLQ